MSKAFTTARQTSALDTYYLYILVLVSSAFAWLPSFSRRLSPQEGYPCDVSPQSEDGRQPFMKLIFQNPLSQTQSLCTGDL